MSATEFRRPYEGEDLGNYAEAAMAWEEMQADIDTIYNRLREHEAGEHTTSWTGCPTCEGWEAEAKRLIGEV